MKSVEECIGDIGRSGSTIFSTLDLSSGFWQLPLAPESQKLNICNSSSEASQV
jgi:hypothetical protein